MTTITISPRVVAGLTELRKVFRLKAFWVLPQETHLYFLSTLPDPSPLLPVLEETAEAKGHKFENRLQDEDDSEDVIADLQSLVQNLAGVGARCRVSLGPRLKPAPPLHHRTSPSGEAG